MTVETAPVTAPVEVVTPIKPSEAIRLGELFLPYQAFGSPGNETAGCVVATAMRGGFRGMAHIFDDANGRPHYPACPDDGCDYLGAPLHLNDDHRWSRERIADWLEGLGL